MHTSLSFDEDCAPTHTTLPSRCNQHLLDTNEFTREQIIDLLFGEAERLDKTIYLLSSLTDSHCAGDLQMHLPTVCERALRARGETVARYVMCHAEGR